MIDRNLKYQSEEKGPFKDFNLNRLSPLTEYFLKISETALKKNKNIILVNSHHNYNSSLILAHGFATKYQKSVYINFGDNVSTDLNDDYYLMKSHIPAYRRAPIGIIDDDGNFDVRPYIPKGARKTKDELKKDIKKYVNQNVKSRIALGAARHSDEASLLKTNFDVHQIGLIITDLGSQINKNFIDGVIKWVKSRDNQFLFLIDSTEVELIEHLASNIDAVIVPLIPNVYLKDDFITKNSIDYFNNRTFPMGSKSFCVDNSYTYEKDPTNDVVEVYNSPTTLNYLRSKLYSLYKKKIYVQNHDMQNLINTIVYITDLYIKSFLVPPLLHLPVKLSEGHPPKMRYTSKKGVELINILSRKMDDLEPADYRYCRDIIDTHNSIYRLINESKRYKRNYPYKRENKTYVLLDILEKRSKDYSDILVITINKHERLELENMIKRYFSDLFEENKIKIMNQENAYRSKKDYDFVIFSSRLDKQYKSLSVRYGNSVMLGYADSEADYVRAQIKYNTEASDKLVLFYNESISKNTLNLGVEGIMSEIILTDVLEEENKNVDTDELLPDDSPLHSENNIEHNNEDSIEDILGSIRDTVKKSISRKELDEDDDIGAGILSEATSPEELYDEGNAEDTSIVEVRLTNLVSNTSDTFYLNNRREYVFYNLQGKTKEIIVSVINEKKIGMGIILMGNNRNSELNYLVTEVYGSNDVFDERIINLWKDEVENITFEHGDKTYLHEKYREIGGDKSYAAFIGWLNLDVIAPQQAEDLKLLGEVLESDNIIHYYELVWEEANKFRNLSRNFGRKFNKIISSIAKKDQILDPDTEYMRQFLNDKVFRIDDIR